MNMKQVIFDCDGGSDDAWALLLLLQADREQRICLLGITLCGCGNTNLENALRNVVRILVACNRLEIPIFMGAADPLIPKKDYQDGLLFHGKDGFGDVLEDNDIEIVDCRIEKEHAVSKINNICAEKPKSISLIVTGPLTNLALCYAMYPNFAKNVKDIFIMGGNYQGVGNYTRGAEFNFYCDPEAAHIVLEKSLCPVTILPWEPCTGERFPIGINWRLKEFGKMAESSSAAIKMLNKVERAQWTLAGFDMWNPCDAMLVAVYLFDAHAIRKESKWHATVDLIGSHTRGQMVLDHLQDVIKYPKNVRIIEQIDAEFFKSVAQWAVGLKDLNIST